MSKSCYFDLETLYMYFDMIIKHCRCNITRITAYPELWVAYIYFIRRFFSEDYLNKPDSASGNIIILQENSLAAPAII
jgi:hypothetical protein